MPSYNKAVQPWKKLASTSPGAGPRSTTSGAHKTPQTWIEAFESKCPQEGRAVRSSATFRADVNLNKFITWESCNVNASTSKARTPLA